MIIIFIGVFLLAMVAGSLIIFKAQECAWLTLVILLLSMLIIFSAFLYGREMYKQGQVDALTGNIKMELTAHEDSTKTWEWIKEYDKD